MQYVSLILYTDNIYRHKNTKERENCTKAIAFS